VAEYPATLKTTQKNVNQKILVKPHKSQKNSQNSSEESANDENCEAFHES
jgi:hypothetical protein